MVAVCMSVALVLALWADLRLGEPPARWHPVVWMGHYLGWWGKRIAPTQATTGTDLAALAKGASAWLLGAAVVVATTWALQRLGLLALAALPPLRTGAGSATLLPWLGVAGVLAVLLAGLLKPLLAWALLRDEVLAVERALGDALPAGRERLSRLVSRDVAALTPAQVRESAIESLAENLNDSLVAPVFWFVLAGLPGAALYRYANTADAMWGYPGLYQGRYWAWAGKWAARADDVLSWLPARITGLLLLALADDKPLRRLRQLRREAAQTPSPNSGWPMAAMALALDVRLSKPGVYQLHAKGREALAADTHRAVALGAKAVAATVFIAVLAIVAIAMFKG
jgi:adenosylcobinamide-phosphate synthase